MAKSKPLKVAAEFHSFVVVDLRDQMQQIRGAGYPHGWTGKGPGKGVERFRSSFGHVTVHQNYGNIFEREKGPLATARFCTASPLYQCSECNTKWRATPKQSTCPNDHPGKSKRIGGGRGFPTMPYHVWVPFRAVRAAKSNDGWHYTDARTAPLVVYWCVDFKYRTWHGGAANALGVALTIQGRHYSRHLGKAFAPWPGTNGRMTAEQRLLLREVHQRWLAPSLQIKTKDITGHFDFGKLACPGDEAEEYVRRCRGERVEATKQEPTRTSNDTWKERQRALVELGYDLGDFGPNKDGVDGAPGDYTRDAIEAFQEAAGITVDGFWGPETERAIKAALTPSKPAWVDPGVVRLSDPPLAVVSNLEDNGDDLRDDSE